MKRKLALGHCTGCRRADRQYWRQPCLCRAGLGRRLAAGAGAGTAGGRVPGPAFAPRQVPPGFKVGPGGAAPKRLDDGGRASKTGIGGSKRVGPTVLR